MKFLKSKSFKNEKGLAPLLLIVILALVYLLYLGYLTMPVKMMLLIAGVCLAMLLIGFALRMRDESHIKKEKSRKKDLSSAKKARFDEDIRKVQWSSNRADYLISGDDYKRGIEKENLYRKLFFLSLCKAYDNRCAKCGTNSNGVEIDHFFLSKNEGGCFIMRHKDGYLVNNAVILCKSCNRLKSDQSYLKFFSKDELLNILKQNLELTALLNESQILNSDGSVANQKDLSLMSPFIFFMGGKNFRGKH